MNRLACLLALPLLGVAACAQVDVDLVLDRQFFLPAEPIEVGVRVANFTGSPLTLGAEKDWLSFTVEEVKGRVVSKLAEPSESGEFTLKQATRGTLRWNLAPLFAIDHPGPYRVVATVRLPSGEVYTTEAANFEIVSGVRLNEPREVGVKMPDGSFERRKYILQQVNFMKKVQLYLRVMDAHETQTFAVTPLGPTVSFDRPQWVVDAESRFHVLHRADSNNYLYHVFRGDGTLTIRQLWASEEGRPELRVNGEGEVRVFGGVRRPSAADLPASVGTNSVSGTNRTNAPPPGAAEEAGHRQAPATNPPEAKINDVTAPPP
jgi:hypothetical protein